MLKEENRNSTTNILDKNFLSFIEKVPTGLIIFSIKDDVRVLYFNEMTCSLCGYSKDEYQNLINTDGLSTISKEDRVLFLDEQAQSYIDKRPFDLTYRRVHKDGHFVWVNLKAVINSESQEGITYYGVFSLFDEKQILGVQVERNNMLKNRFLALVSHEIRSPLNSIIGLTTLAKGKISDTEKTLDYLFKIESSSRILLSMINDILDMSAIENKKIKISHNQFDLKALIFTISSIFYDQCTYKGIKFETVLSEIKSETLIGDQLRLNQVLLNLLTNAIKYSDPGGSIRLRVIQSSTKLGKVNMRFEISDTVCSINEKMVRRLFELNEQESNDTLLNSELPGLGLSVSKNLISLMNGNISVYSSQKACLSIIVELPFDVISEEPVKLNLDLDSYKILVVDDDEISLKYDSALLTRFGANYDLASSGEEALIKLEQAKKNDDPYKVCIIDWQMPHMDGIELTKTLRKNYDNDIIIIIISSFDLSEASSSCLEAGANAVLAKPLFQSSLFNLLIEISRGKIPKHAIEKRNYNFSGHRVLLAEDNDLNREIVCEVLEMVNLDVEEAVNGLQAVNKFSQSRSGYYDCILMDIEMPELNGYQATNCIRNSLHKDAKVIPIIAMTANAFVEDVNEAFSVGMNGHVAKPIDIDELFSKIDKCINC